MDSCCILSCLTLLSILIYMTRSVVRVTVVFAVTHTTYPLWQSPAWHSPAQHSPNEEEEWVGITLACLFMAHRMWITTFYTLVRSMTVISSSIHRTTVAVSYIFSFVRWWHRASKNMKGGKVISLFKCVGRWSCNCKLNSFSISSILWYGNCQYEFSCFISTKTDISVTDAIVERGRCIVNSNA